jgi:hypothetical protein
MECGCKCGCCGVHLCVCGCANACVCGGGGGCMVSGKYVRVCVPCVRAHVCVWVFKVITIQTLLGQAGIQCTPMRQRAPAPSPGRRLPWCQGRNATSVEGTHAPPVDIHKLE